MHQRYNNLSSSTGFFWRWCQKIRYHIPHTTTNNRQWNNIEKTAYDKVRQIPWHLLL